MTARHHLNRIMILTVPMLLLMLSSAAFAPVFADGLSLQPSGIGPCAPVNISSGSASVTCPPTGSSALTVTTTAEGNLSTGVFGALSFVSDTGGTGLGSGADVSSYFQVTYLFNVSGAANGTAQFDITASGVLASNTGTANAEFEYVGETGTLNGAPLPPGGTPLGGGTSDIVIITPVAANGTTELQFALALTTHCAGSQQCTSNADFLDPTSITGASAFDANGNLVSGASFISQSGFNPNAGNPVPTPEPSSLLLLGAGLLALIGTAKLKAFTT